MTSFTVSLDPRVTLISKSHWPKMLIQCYSNFTRPHIVVDFHLFPLLSAVHLSYFLPTPSELSTPTSKHGNGTQNDWCSKRDLYLDPWHRGWRAERELKGCTVFCIMRWCIVCVLVCEVLQHEEEEGRNSITFRTTGKYKYEVRIWIQYPIFRCFSVQVSVCMGNVWEGKDGLQ